jgi:CubicO group peptidase (beta-lactamase class C family)
LEGVLALNVAKVWVEKAVHGSAFASKLCRWAGAVVAVVRLDETQLVALGRGVASDTPVQIASVTKAYTGLLLADATLRGELTLDTTVDELLLGKPATERSITVRSLATHTSGLPRLSLFARTLLPDPYRGYTWAHLHRYLERTQPQLAATQAYRYSNLGFAVLGAMLEKACGKTYAELLRARVLSPLGLMRTQLALTGEKLRVKRGYARFRSTPVWLWPRPPVWHHDAYAPCGALVSTAQDLVRFAQQLLDEQGPVADAFQLSCQPQATIPGGAAGLAWHLPGSRRFVWHNGSTFGHSAYVAIARERGVAVIAVANQPGAMEMTQLGHGLMKQALA